MHLVTGTLMVCLAVTVGSQPLVVPVVKEPRHMVTLENEVVRVLDIVIPPSDSTLFHQHLLDMASLVIEGTDVTNQPLEGQPSKVLVPTGTVLYAPAEQPYTHRIANVSTRRLRVVSVEIRVPAAERRAVRRIRGAPYELVLENRRVWAWRAKLEPGQSVSTENTASPSVRVFQRGGTVQGEGPGQRGRAAVHAGDAQWMPEGTTGALRNVGDSAVEWVEFELQ
jgi:hypothetical protein